MSYFIIKKGEKDGPFSISDIQEMKLLNDTLVWKEGFENWKQAKEIEELKTITFTPPPPIPKKQVSAEEIIKIICIHLFFGLGFYYVDKSVKRKIIYPIFAIYSWLAYAHVFIKISEPIERFHNGTAFGAATIFIGWGITYIIGFIDVFYHFYKINSKTENN